MAYVVRKTLSIIGNFYWKIFGGVVLWALWFAVAVIFALTIIGFPFALLFFRISWVAFKPFGKSVVMVEKHLIWSVIWFFSVGLVLGMYCVFNMLISMATIVGLPLTKQWFKMAKLSFFPFCTQFG